MASTSHHLTDQLRLIVVIGPTAVGKSSYALRLAKELNTVIISADSRQVYQGMSIGTAAPTPAELEQVQHFFIHTLPVTAEYDAATYASDARSLLTELHHDYPAVVMVGGSMMYLQAFLEGLDPIPEVDPAIRDALWEEWGADGLVPLRKELQRVDPSYLGRIDPNNHKRIIRALEVYRGTGRPYTSYHTGEIKVEHPYQLEVHSIERPRAELYDRIDRRVDQMFADGLVDEVRAFLPYRGCNALNTIGYKEVFQYLDGDLTESEAQQLIKRSTRTFARQQERFFRRWTETPPEGWKVIKNGW